jgi:hypothetical protein
MGYSASSSSGASQGGDSGYGNQGINFGSQSSGGISTNTILIGIGLLLAAKALKLI